ncbi:MAG: hypothetical protein HUU02_08150, partial [Bacteroidetes bacterium]|nr:hypothetical protein [Bacteroidota bacterium]
MKFILCCILLLAYPLQAESWIRINQLGYSPGSIKRAVVVSTDSALSVTRFRIHQALTGALIDSFHSVQRSGPYGPFTTTYALDFTSFRTIGAFYISFGNTRSRQGVPEQLSTIHAVRIELVGPARRFSEALRPWPGPIDSGYLALRLAVETYGDHESLLGSLAELHRAVMDRTRTEPLELRLAVVRGFLGRFGARHFGDRLEEIGYLAEQKGRILEAAVGLGDEGLRRELSHLLCALIL